MAFALPQAFGWNILVATGIAAHVVIIGGMYAGAARRKYQIKYPDMGSGRYCAKLTDAQWEDFNNSQRAHYNYVEGVASAITLELIGGLFFPRISAVLGVAYMVGRQLYARGYVKNGPSGRVAGALIFDSALLGWFGICVFGSLKTLGYIA